jgi:drug/metabolite transporter (DMT)-like permease
MTTTRTQHLWAVIGMVPVTLVWGCSFAAMKVAIQTGISVGAMLALRASVGALILGAFLLVYRPRIDRQSLQDGLWLGFVAIIIFWLQADGLRFTSTSKSGFITGLYVLFTPLVSLLFRDRLRLSHAMAAILATLGLYMLVHVPGAPMGGWNRGDSETLICAVGCGFQIVLTAHFSRRSHALVLAFVQIAALAVASWILAVAIPSHPLADGTRLGGLGGTLRILATPHAWASILYLGALATALAFYLMSRLQAHLGATEAAILYSLEPVFAAALAVSGWIPGICERLTLFQIAGGIIILFSMLLAELGPRFFRTTKLESETAIG